MKKFILTLTALVAMAVQADAQTFTFQKGDTVKAVASESGVELKNNVTNTTSGTYKITWKIIYHNLPAAPSKWNTGFGLCDNKLCYANTILTGTSQTSVDVTAGSTMPFYITYSDLAGATETGPLYISVELTQGSFKDTCTFVLSKWATSVNNISNKSDNISLYPNPATNEVNVIFNGMNDVKSVGIYNLIGKLQSIYKVSGTSANINVENLPSGIYLMRLMDNQGHPVAVRKFNKQ
ncbi:hypothetical protein CAP35_03430 [Chitinophagaceae bacterium IBVUCB1]|nr:hypothetical protein CAP35_03430 [Chitinophagaceae bacterium IBVUCB1]